LGVALSLIAFLWVAANSNIPLWGWLLGHSHSGGGSCSLLLNPSEGSASSS
jgi:hypothetical protein